MSNTRKRYSSEYKVKVVLEILSNTGTLTEIAGKYGLHPTMISTWKAEFLEKSKEVFTDPRIKKVDSELKQKEEALDEAHRQIGQLTIERDWLKKNINSLDEFDHKRKLSLIDVNFHLLTITRQTELLGISRSSYYYQPRVNPEKIRILNKLDEIYTHHPFLGSRRLHILLKQEGIDIGRNKVRSYMKILGIQTLYPHKNTGIPNKAHKKYPYLLKDVDITRSNQVGSTDITYIRMKKGFIYLIAIIDWYSRKVLSWRVSNTLYVNFCTDVLQEAIEKYGTPEIFNGSMKSIYQ